MADRQFLVLYLMLVPSNNSEYFQPTCHDHKEKKEALNPIGIKTHLFVIQNLRNTVDKHPQKKRGLKHTWNGDNRVLS